jgi:hypothetical protein
MHSHGWAVTDLQLHSLTCKQFLPVVTGFPLSGRQVRASIDPVLKRFPTEGPADDTGLAHCTEAATAWRSNLEEAWAGTAVGCKQEKQARA